MSLIPPRQNISYGFFGYEGAMCDSAIRSDNAPMLKECIERGWIDSDTCVLGFRNALQFCEARGFEKCAELLRQNKATA